MILHGFASRRQKNTVLRPKTLKSNQKPKHMTQKNLKNHPKIFKNTGFPMVFVWKFMTGLV